MPEHLTPRIQTDKLQILITGDSDVTLWRLSGRQRLERQFSRFANVVLADDFSVCTDDTPLLLVRGDYVYVQKLITALVNNNHEFILIDNADNTPVAFYMQPGSERARLVAQFRDGITSEGYQLLQNNDMVKPFDEGLRKYEPVDVHKITADKKLQLEDFLFGSAYKGVTDFVTRFIWPKPAAIVTRLCAAWGVTPNQVTLLGLLLMLAAGVLFWHGWFLCGLLLAWVMTFLDTVDGKLARVTVSSSVTGHALDHGMDILHPPGWYFAWGIGLFNQGLLADTFVPLMFCMFIAYTGGRMIEGAFELYTPISIFIWRRFDSLNRLITARRNPNMVLLTCCTILGQPLQGLYAVVIWHSVSTLILLWRLGLALYDTGKGQPIESWLAHLQPTTAKTDWATRLFLQRPSPPPHQDSC